MNLLEILDIIHHFKVFCTIEIVGIIGKFEKMDFLIKKFEKKSLKQKLL